MGNLELLISELMLSDAVLTETWFKSRNYDELFSREVNHQPYTSTRTQKRDGGVALYLTLDIFPNLVLTINTDSERRKIQHKQQHFNGNKHKRI